MNDMIQPDEKALTAFDAKALGTLEVARGIVISDDEGYSEVGEFLKGLKSYQKDLDATFDGPIKAATASLSAIREAKDRHAKPIKEAEALTKGKLVEYMTSRQAQIEAENKARAIEAAKASIEALKSGKSPKDLAKPEVLSMPKVKGLSYVDSWEAEITDLELLIRSIQNNKLPFSIATVKEELEKALIPALKKFGKATKGEVETPGVKYTHTKTARGSAE